MFYEMIKRKRDAWLSTPDCPVRATIQAMVNASLSGTGLRDIQIDAIKTYLFLKIACGNKPLADLFSSGALTSLELTDDMLLSGRARDHLMSHPASLALLEFALQKESGAKSVLAPALEKMLRDDPAKIDAENVFRKIFYNVKYSDYLFSLPMGAGKTYLMAAFIYLDLMYAHQEPENPAFAHNFLVLAPSGTKSSIVPSLRTIENFDPAWVVPEPLASQLKGIVKFETLDADATAAKSNQVKNPNVQKIARFQPYDEMFGVVLVTNAEKVILDKVALDESGLLIPLTEEEKTSHANELRATIAKIPSLAIMIDEAHHTASQSVRDDEVKLRAVVNNWAESENGVYQLFIEYGDKVIEETVPVAQRLNSLKRRLRSFQKDDTITVGDFKEVRKRISTKHGEYSDVGFATTYLAWLRQISKESFGLLSVDNLKAEDAILHSIFEKISVRDADGDSVLSPQYRQAEIRAGIRRSFWPSRKIEIKEHDNLTNARLLDVDYLAANQQIVVEDDTPFVPDQRKCLEIVRADAGGVQNIVLKPSQIATMEEFIDNVRVVLSALGNKFLVPQPSVSITMQTFSCVGRRARTSEVRVHPSLRGRERPCRPAFNESRVAASWLDARDHTADLPS